MSINTRPWMLAAVCRGMDPNLFMPVRGADTSAAKAVCADCPVRSECLDYALELRQGGIWGGTSERERRRMQRGTTVHKTVIAPSVSMQPDAVRRRAMRARRAAS